MLPFSSSMRTLEIGKRPYRGAHHVTVTLNGMNSTAAVILQPTYEKDDKIDLDLVFERFPNKTGAAIAIRALKEQLRKDGDETLITCIQWVSQDGHSGPIDAAYRVQLQTIRGKRWLVPVERFITRSVLNQYRRRAAG